MVIAEPIMGMPEVTMWAPQLSLSWLCEEVTCLVWVQAREQYRSAAAGASTFYFVVADLALISPMYQTSLSYFITMFAHCIDASDKAPDVTARLRLLTTFATRFIFDKMQRGLFEQHKLLFSFMLATATARASGQVTQVCPY